MATVRELREVVADLQVFELLRPTLPVLVGGADGDPLDAAGELALLRLRCVLAVARGTPDDDASLAYLARLELGRSERS